MSVILLMPNVCGGVAFAIDEIEQSANQDAKAVDVTAPKINFDTLQVSTKEAKPGDTVKISLEATDENGIEYVVLYYQRPITGDNHSVDMSYNYETKKYEGNIDITEMTQPGEWKISRIDLRDTLQNYISMKPSDYDFTNLSFTVKEDELPYTPLAGVTAVTKNTSWSNKKIEGDLYIGPDTVLTINSNVTVTGNVYVLGALRSYGGLTVNGAVRGTNASFGGG